RAAEERKSAAQHQVLESRSRAQRRLQLFGKTSPARLVGILGLRQGRDSDPEIVRFETGVLMAQAHEARDEQRRAREQCDRERDLRADENFAEPVLTDPSLRAAAAV